MQNNPDWQQVVNQLLENRTQIELKELTGIPQSTISDLKNGVVKPRLPWASGNALLMLLERDQRKMETPQ